MNPEELSEEQKWDNYHAAMAKEREYIALREKKITDEQAPNVWQNCIFMAGPVFLTVTSTFSTGLPLAGLLVVPGTFVSLAMWIISKPVSITQAWRSLFWGCLFSYFFLGVLASQW